jgi:cyclic lactone autoinducer peptide
MLESITIFLFLSLLFVVKFSPKHVFVLAAISASVYFSEKLDNPILIWLLLISLVTCIWSISQGFNLKNIYKTFISLLICALSMLIIQFWIPLYLLISNADPKIITDNEFWFGLPCRLTEYIILFGIYSFKVKSIIASKAVTRLAKNTMSLTSLWWVYQPKAPKSLKKVT